MANIRTTSQLPPVDSFDSGTLFAVSQPYRNGSMTTYSARCLSAGKLEEETRKYVLDKFGQPPYHLTEKIDFTRMDNCISTLVNGNDYNKLSPPFSGLIYAGKHEFEKLPIFHESLSSFDAEYNKYAVNVETLKNFEDSSNALMINSGASFKTNYFSVEDNMDIDLSGISNAPDESKENYHNSFVFRIQGNESNVWTCPANGMFTCYGWVDERNTENITANAKRWVALEGFFFDEKGNEYWKILSLQPVIGSAYCSYVGFTYPVNQGMRLRLRCGFNVGTNSDKYEAVMGSLTNHIANAFVGGIYSKHSWGYSVPGGGGGGGPDKFIDDVKMSTAGNNLVIKLNRDNGNETSTILSSYVPKNNFVSWLSGEIFRAIVDALPPTIVTNIQNSNLGINSSPALSSGVVFNKVEYNSISNKYVGGETVRIASGTPVAGTNCGSGSSFSSKAPSSSIDDDSTEEEERYDKLIEDIRKEIED